jgi:hypothetical protein
MKSMAATVTLLGMVAAGAVNGASASPLGGAPDTALASEAGDAKPKKGLDITYRTTSTGLVIELEGLRLEPKAEPMKTPHGWDIKLFLRATAMDSRAHRLLNPERGPLMVAGEVARAGGNERFGDERKGDEESVVDKGGTRFVRDVKHPIKAGQAVTVYVGLWGVAHDEGDRKAVKRLFVVKMVAGANKPSPVITPPDPE